MKKLVLSLAVLAVAAFASAQPFVWPGEWFAEPEAANSGGTVTIGTLSGSRTFNPFVTGEQDVIFDRAFYSTSLITRDPTTRQWIPYAAESFELSEDGTQVTVKLRDGVQWSDGTPVTARDYVFYYTGVTDPEIESPRAEDWLIGDDLVKLEALDDMTLLFSFPQADREAISTVATYPAPDHILGEVYREGGAEALKAEWGTETPLDEMVWAGTYIPTLYSPDERYVFEPNPGFQNWNVDEAGNPLPYLDALEYTIASQEAQLNLYLAGELDINGPANLDELGVIANAIDTGELDAVLLESLYPQAGTTFYVFNWNKSSEPHKEALFRNPVFRRAMSHLTPREAMVDLIYGGAAEPAYSPVGPSFSFWYPEEPLSYPYDPEEALNLLASIGITEKNADGWLVDADGNEVGFTLSTNSGNANREQQIQLIADAMREVGVKAETQALEFSLLVDQLLATGDDRPFDAILIGFGASTEDWPFFEGIFSCTAGFHMWNQSGDCISPQERLVAELVRKGRATLDDEEARQIGYQIIEEYSKMQPIIYTTSQSIHASWLNRIGGEWNPDLFSSFNTTRDSAAIFTNDD